MPTELSAKLSAGQKAYEQKRAAKAGMSLEKWLVSKEKRAAEAAAPVVPKKPGFISRLLDKAHKPLAKR